MLSRVTAGLVLVAMLMVGAAPCAGWQASAQARHDCCEKGVCPDSVGAPTGLGDMSQAAADRCCATSEEKAQRDRSASNVAIFAVHPPATIGFAPLTETVHLRMSTDAETPIGLHAPPLYVLFSVFLV